MEGNRKAVEYTFIQRGAHTFQQPVAAEHIQAMCERAFGPGVVIHSVRELGGGQFNNTYLLNLAGHDLVVLRVAPSPERTVFWHERFLMRRELAMQPLLAPIGSLLPTILMSDCTRQILARDYLFQRWIPGALWWDVAADLTVEEHDELWCQFGRCAHDLECAGRGLRSGAVRSPVFHVELDAARLVGTHHGRRCPHVYGDGVLVPATQART